MEEGKQLSQDYPIKLGVVAGLFPCARNYNGLLSLPEELKALPQWVLFKFTPGKKNEKLEKIPYDAHTREKARVNDPQTWSAFLNALEVCKDKHSRWDGVGFVFARGGEIVGIDLDRCRDPHTGRLEPWARGIIERIDSYTEVSPSGTGVHIFAKGILPPGGRRCGDVEMYDVNRFFTVTGEHLDGTPSTLEKRTAAIAALHTKLFGAQSDEFVECNTDSDGSASIRSDFEIFALGQRAKNNAKFLNLWRGRTASYPSRSEADLALCSILAHYTGDPVQVDRLFRQSALYRSKWDEQHGSSTYGDRTIRKALKNTVQEKMRKLRARALSTPWDGRAGKTRLIVLLALYAKAAQLRKLTFEVDTRTLAEEAGVSQPTSHRAIRSLVHKGWILRHPRIGKEPTDANTFTLLWCNPESYLNTQSTTVKTYDSFLHLGHDAFRYRKGLGKSAFLFLELVKRSPVPTLADIAHKISVSLRTAKTLASRLKQFRLVRKTAAGWARGEEVDLDKVAKALGVAGTGAQQHEKHARERKKYGQRLQAKRLKQVPVREQRNVGIETLHIPNGNK